MTARAAAVTGLRRCDACMHCGCRYPVPCPLRMLFLLRCRGFGVVSFPTQADADAAVERTNGMEVGGRTVTVRIDRFA